MDQSEVVRRRLGKELLTRRSRSSKRKEETQKEEERKEKDERKAVNLAGSSTRTWGARRDESVCGRIMLREKRGGAGIVGEWIITPINVLVPKKQEKKKEEKGKESQKER